MSDKRLKIAAGAAAFWFVAVLIAGLFVIFSGANRGKSEEPPLPAKQGPAPQKSGKTIPIESSPRKHAAPARQTAEHRTPGRPHRRTRPTVRPNRSADSPDTAETAQSEIRGMVFSKGGNPLAETEITALETRTGDEHATTTRQDGSFMLSCGNGDFRVTAVHPDYLPSDPKTISLRSGTTEKIRFTLDPGCSLYGTVTDVETGLPISDAAVSVRKTGSDMSRKVRTGPEGAYRLQGLAHGLWLFSVTSEAYRDIVNMHLKLDPSESREYNPKLHQGAVLVVKIVPPEDQTVNNITLHLKSENNRGKWINLQGSENMFQKSGLNDGTYTVGIRCKGYMVAQEKDAVLQAGRKTTLTFVLKKGSTLSGRILDPDGNPITGARLYASVFLNSASRYTNATAVSGKNGSYLLSGLPEKEVKLRIRADGYVTNKTDIDFSKTPQMTKDFILKKGIACRGVVRTGSGEPLADTSVMIYSNQGTYANGVSGKDGEFKLTGLAPGKHTVRATHSKYGILRKRDVEIHTGDNFIELTFAGEYTVTGIVKDEQDKPVSNAFVYMTPKDQTVKDTHRTRTGKDGTFTLHGIRSAVYSLSARARGYGRESRDVSGGDKNIEIFLKKQPTLQGRVLDRASGEAVSQFTVHVLHADSGAMVQRKSFKTADGSFEIPMNRPSRKEIRIRVIADGYAVFTTDPIETADGPPTAEITVSLGQGKRISGIVTSEDGPVTGAVVKLSPGKEVFRSSRVVAKTLSDASGAFTLKNTGDGQYILKVTHADYAPLVREIRVRPGMTTLPDIVLGPGGTITGTVNTAQESADSIPVRIANPETRYFKSIKTDADGNFTFTGLAPGEYTLSIFVSQPPENFGPRTRKIRVKDGDTVTVNFGKN